MGKQTTSVCAVFITALFFSSCYESSGNGRDATPDDAVDRVDLQPDIRPDVFPDYLPDILPDFPDADYDIHPDYPPDLPPEDMPFITAEQYCRSIAFGVCSYFLNCCSVDELETLRWMELDCEDPLRTEIYYECMNNPGDFIRAGRIIVDPVGLADLEAQLFSYSEICPNFGSSPFIKDHIYDMLTAPVLVGQVPEGESCMDGEECLEHLYCNFYTSTCEPRQRLGGVCREHEECDPGFVCSRGRCAEPGLEGSFCNGSEACDLGLWCDTGFCRPLLPAGSSCDMDMMNCEGLCSFDYPYVCRDFCNGI